MKAAGLPSMLMLIIVAGMVVVARAEAPAELDDAAARIQYAFFTDDVRALEQALERLQQVQPPPAYAAMKDYYTAYAYWKLAQLLGDRVLAGTGATAGDATRAASACEKAAERAISIDARLSEAHAMRAICAGLASRVPSILSFGDCARHKSLRTARELTPNNVRVRFIEALCAFGGDDSGFGRLGRENEAGGLIAQVQALVQDFAAASPPPPGLPDWGQAEALVLLGRLHLQLGQQIPARDALERALAIAPDYRKARLALGEVGAHGR